MSSIQSQGPRLVARGNFDVLSVQSVLQALSISRQHTTVYFHSDDGSMIGRVFLKSGMLLGVDVRNESVQGIAALKRLLGKPMSGYTVERVASRVGATPLAPLTDELLSPALAQEPVEPSPPSSVPKPAAPSTPLPSIAPASAAPSSAAPSSAAPPTATPPSVRASVPESKTPTAAPAPSNGSHAPAQPEVAPRPTVPAPAAVPSIAKSPSPPVPSSPAGAKATVSEPKAMTPPRETVATEPGASAAVPIVAVASPKGGSGKTTVVLNLAVSFARSGLKVLIIDLDPNGDVLSSLAAREAASAGVYDYLAGNADVDTLRLATVLPELGIIPARGATTPNLQGANAPDHGQFRDLFTRASHGVDVVLVDTPAGMFGLTQAALSACTHVLGVFQAEAIAARSFATFAEVLSSLDSSPTVAGVAVNMFSRDRDSSRSALAKITDLVSSDWLLGATIPFSDALLESADRGLPVSIGKGASPALGGLFDALAGEVRERIGLAHEQHAPSSFVVT